MIPFASRKLTRRFRRPACGAGSTAAIDLLRRQVRRRNRGVV